MALSAKALTSPNKLRNYHRLRRGYNNLVWGREFGTAKVDLGPSIAITSASNMFNPTIGGFMPTMEPYLFTCNYLPGNMEVQRYMNDFGMGQPSGTVTLLNGRSRAPRFGQSVHVVNSDHVALKAILDPVIDTNQKLVDCHFNSNPMVHAQVNLSINGSPLVVQVDGNKLVQIGKQYYIAPSYQRNSGCIATLDSYTNNGDGTASATFTKNYLSEPTAGGGSHNQLHFHMLAYDTACLSTRTMLPPVFRGYWEARLRLPAGKGLWPAWWFIRNNAWPPEIDMIEVFREGASELNNIHSGAIEAVSGGTWTQRFRTLSNYCVRDGTGASTFEIDWDYDLTTGYHTVGIEFRPNGTLGFTLDDTLGKSIQYDWVVHKNWAANSLVDPPTPAISRGSEQAFPHMVFNLAIGPVMDTYRPNDITKFPASIDIDYVRLFTRSMA